MRLARIAFASFALATMLAAPAAAQIDARVRLANVGAGVTYNFTGDAYGPVYIGHYGFSFVNGPYGSFASMPGLSSTFDAWCVDFDTHVSLGQVWDVNLTRLDEANLNATRLRRPTPAGEGFNNATALSRYKQAAWLTTQFALYANHADRASIWGAIHAAIWNLTGANNPQPTTPSGATGMLSRAYWLGQAGLASNMDAVNLNEFIVMTSSPNVSTAQEFIIRTPTVVPEPGTLFLLGSGLAGMGIAGLRRRRRNNSEQQL
jgi:hypothetical protein